MILPPGSPGTVPQRACLGWACSRSGGPISAHRGVADLIPLDPPIKRPAYTLVAEARQAQKVSGSRRSLRYLRLFRPNAASGAALPGCGQPGEAGRIGTMGG